MRYGLEIPKIPEELGTLAKTSLEYVKPITYENEKKKISSKGVEVLRIISKTLSEIEMDALRLGIKDLEKAIIPDIDLKSNLRGLEQYINKTKYFEQIKPFINAANSDISRAIGTETDTDFTNLVDFSEKNNCPEYISNAQIIPVNNYLTHKHEILKDTAILNGIFEDNDLIGLHEMGHNKSKDILKEAGFKVMNRHIETVYTSKDIRRAVKFLGLVGIGLGGIGILNNKDTAMWSGAGIIVPSALTYIYLSNNSDIIETDKNTASELMALLDKF